MLSDLFLPHVVLGQLNYLPFFYLAESVKAPVNTADWHYAHQPLSDKKSASLTARSFAWTARGRWSDKGKRTWYLLPFNNCTLSGIPDRSGMSNESVAVCVLSEQRWLIFPGPFGWPELQPAWEGGVPLRLYSTWRSLLPHLSIEGLIELSDRPIAFN